MKKFYLLLVFFSASLVAKSQCGITYVADTSNVFGFGMTFDFSGLSDPSKGSAEVIVERKISPMIQGMVFDESMYAFDYMLLANANYRYYGVVTDTTTGCQDSISADFVVLNQPGGFLCDPTFAYSHDSLAMTWQFWNTVNYHPAGTIYQWHVGGPTLYGDTITKTYASEIITMRPIEVNVYGPGCEWNGSMAWDTVYSGYLQECVASFDLFADSIQGDTYWAYNNSYGGFISHYWDFGDGGTSTDPFPTYVYNTPGQYNLCLTVDDTSGCQSMFCDTIDVLVKSTGTTLNVLDPNASAGIDKYSFSQIEIFPNPTSGSFVIKFYSQESGLAEFIVHDLKGQIVYRKMISHTYGSNSQLIELPDIEKGLYLYSLNGLTRKLIIQ